MKKILLFLLILFILGGCKTQKPVTGTECLVDSDCITAGCSSQLCVSNEKSSVVTSCEYKPEYECYKSSHCGCIQGTCSWDQDTQNCANAKKGSGITPI